MLVATWNDTTDQQQSKISSEHTQNGYEIQYFFTFLPVKPATADNIKGDNVLLRR